MICQRKQIQTRKFIDNFKSLPNPSYKPHTLLSKNYLKNSKNQSIHEKSYQIDPWHIKSTLKIQDVNPKFSTQLLSPFTNRSAKFNPLIKNIHISPQKTTKQSVQNQLEVTKITGSPYLNEEELGSPAKIDMLECSIRFQQYQQQKAEEIKSIFMSKIITADDKKPVPKQSQNTNFIKRNIKYAFKIQNGKNDRCVTFEKKKTIQETKQQLILNRQKLQQESKQIFKVISMKDQKPNQRPRPKSQTENRQPIIFSSFWNLSYIERAPNPEIKLSRKSHSTITQWKKILKNRSTSENPKQSQTKHQNMKNTSQSANLSKRTYKKNNQEPYKKDTRNQNTLSLSKKLARIWKVKNKQTLVIPSSSEVISNQEQLSQSDVYFHARIHSMSFRGEENKVYRKLSKQQFQTVEPQAFTQFENLAISKLFGVKSEKISRKQSKSLVSNESGRNFPQRQRGRKIKPHQTEKRLMQKNFCIEGNTCQMSQLFAD